MNSYFSTFITGFADVVREEIKKEIPDIKIDLLLDGIIVYRTEMSSEEILNLKFFNNSYLLFQFFKGLQAKPFSEMSDWLKQNLNILSSDSLKLVFVEENQYVHLDKFFVSKLSDAISKKTGIIVDNQTGKEELWFLVRNEGYGVIGLRLYGLSKEKVVQRGEIRPELSYLLCLLSSPSENDVFLDPFSGSGSIARVRRENFPFKDVIESDINSTNSKVHRWDALDLKEIQDQSIDKIVTDPPWGIFGERINIGNFYPQMLKEFQRILKEDSKLVLLLSRDIDFDKILNSFSNNFKIEKRINTLVNGQKATVYKLVLRPQRDSNPRP